MDKNEEKSGSHFYDGIEEHDHPIPIWFSGLFLVTSLFAIGYYAYYEIGTGTSLRATYEKEIAALDLAKYMNRDKNPLPSEDVLLAVLKVPEKLKSAGEVFKTKCASCHGAQGQGGIGPNLTDAYSIHGAKLSEIRHTIAVGVLDKGMPPWEAVLTYEELNDLPAFVHSLRGTHPSGAKEAQGTLVKEE